ncbi:MAG: ThiF family adenylyltransferase, partial [Chloroflexota bacterium]
MTHIFDPHVHIKTIYVVGVGGTGSSAARIIARILYDMERGRKHAPQMILVDHDVVEEKNIGRQALFAPSSVGQNKAVVAARVLSFALGLEIGAIPMKFNPERHTERYGGNLIVSCVDNHEARQAIHRARGVHIGAGNHENAGQCVIGSSSDTEMILHESNWRGDTVHHLPTEGLIFPSLLEPEPVAKPQPDLSCAALVESGAQHLLVNDWMATVIGSHTYKLLHRKPIRTFMTFIDAEDGTVAGKA